MTFGNGGDDAGRLRHVGGREARARRASHSQQDDEAGDDARRPAATGVAASARAGGEPVRAMRLIAR